MSVRRLRRLYAPEYMVSESLKAGEIPPSSEVYSTALRLVWASALEMLLVSLVSMADTIMVSSVGDAAIAAVGIVTQPRMIVQTLILALNVAVTAITARRKGEGDSEGAVSCLKQGLVLSAFFSILTSAIMYTIAEPFLAFTGAQPDMIDMSTGYLRIILIGLPFSSVSLTICAAQRGIGNTKASMHVNMTANVVNIILNYLLIGGNFGFPALGVDGAAIATAVSWVCGLALAVFSVTRRVSFLYIFTRGGWRIKRDMLKSMYQVASGAFGEQICVRLGLFVNVKIVTGLGTVMFAAHHILVNIMSLSFCVGEGFGIAASSLVGQNLGAKRPDMSVIYGKVYQRLFLVVSTALFILFVGFGRNMLRLFTESEEILDIGGRALIVMGVILFAQGAQMILMGSLRGAGDTKYVAVVSMICIMIFRPLATYTCAYILGLGLLGAWVALLADQYLRLLFTHLRFRSGKWMEIKL